MENVTTSAEAIEELIGKLEQFRSNRTDLKVFTGFDGFVDKIQRAIKKKEGGKNIYFDTIKEFSDHLQGLSGKSGQVEVITEQVKMGGNAPILANTLGTMGIKNYCIGSLGESDGVKKEFAGMNRNCEVISVADPGDSRALEFSDGKIILSELGVFDSYNWAYIKSKVGLPALTKMAEECKIFAFVDWVNLPQASNIWDGFLRDVLKGIQKKDLFFLFDLCDPSKKSPQQIDEMLDVIGCFSQYGKVTLGLNENESNRIWLALNGYDSKEKVVNIPPLSEVGVSLHNAMNIDTLLIHPEDRTLIFNQRRIFEMKGRLVTKPKVLTGGGDNLNAGYCLGLLAGLEISQCMLLGMAASGAYIQYGQSPTLDDLIRYLTTWNNELLVEDIK